MKQLNCYVPCDSAAQALGADAVSALLQEYTESNEALGARLLRTSSRGMFWLEPLLEFDTPAGRVGYGPLEPSADAAQARREIESIFAHYLKHCADSANIALAPAHPKFLGLIQSLPYLAKQERLVFARLGITQPLCIDSYEKNGGWIGLKQALTRSPEACWQTVLDSGLRGRGGAAFPTGIKWRTVAQSTSELKYVVCNADEGDSGTFSDRMTMEGDPFMLIEGMIIAAYAVGASKGYIYVRSEYLSAYKTLISAVHIAKANAFLGKNICGTGFSFDIEIRKAAGMYVCGEETAMLDSIEGKRGMVRSKPPLPALEGLFNRPTVINNVITFASVPKILEHGSEFYKHYGMGRSTGTLPFQLAGNIKHAGLVEKAFGVTLRELLFDFGGGSLSGEKIKAVQVGGPLGAYVPQAQWDTPIDYEAYAAVGAVVGHGGVVAHDASANMMELARFSMEFCALESCGKCTPCRIGSTRGVEVIDKIAHAPSAQIKTNQVTLLRDLCDTMLSASLCAMGGMTPYPVLSALDHYPEDFGLEAKTNNRTP